MIHRWKGRTSLFARMSRLFGLLVTVPLVISGLVLSLAGREVVFDIGKAVAGIGSQAVKENATEFNRVARSNLRAAANDIRDLGKERLKATSQKAVEAGTKAVADNTQRIKDRGQEAVGDATRAMSNAAGGAVRSSFQELRQLNQEAIKTLSKDFRWQVRTELDQSTQAIRENLRRSVKNSWQLSADRRALAVRDYVARSVSELQLRLEYPLRTTPIVRAQDPAPAKKVLTAIRKSDKAFPE
ncbi:MAG TPA: hypothetical protein VFU47_05085, partial [Armatimonadota bacterium]|nr:hypothetical protein [Armatimonadota bacterium]